ncbi:hypothetical protein HDU93_008700 [Gonapodya sp. JEL0774]|nr:hypothetical protein HDU93_008700 [Gonapodya sp. JEL0774]
MANAEISAIEQPQSTSDPLTMWIVLRKDLVKACHASTAALWMNREDPIVDEYMKDAASGSTHKVVLEVKGESQLESLAASLDEHGIRYHKAPLIYVFRGHLSERLMLLTRYPGTLSNALPLLIMNALQAAAANERKAAAQSAKEERLAAEKEKSEAADWAAGAKQDKRAEQEAKRLEALRRKEEIERLLAEEEKSLAPKPKVKVDLRPPSIRASSSSSSSASPLLLSNPNQRGAGSSNGLEEYAASNIDDALDLLTAVHRDVGSGNGGDDSTESFSGKRPNLNGADKVERHPERRVKSAYAAFEEENMEKLKKENPTLRHSQLKQMVQKLWKKSPLNPLNQASIAYNATREEETHVAISEVQETLQRLRV